MIDLSMLKELCGLPGVSGRENAVRDYIISKIDGFADYETDNLGNLIVHKKGLKQAKAKLMIAAHMDEVGVVASHITDGGFIKFVTAGSIGPGVLLGRALIFESGARGVVGIKPVHLVDDADKDKLPKLENLYIDIGADSREEALKHVRIGDSAVFDSGFMEFGDNKIKSKALDDRVGCAIMISLIQSEIEYDTA
ncbi:MAG: M42 family peptidase, partial [Oscillospiraceae bacterium]|nr:M42 family peptidase [Oscillospiraceae bacterium]